MSGMRLKVYNYNNLPNVVSYIILNEEPCKMTDLGLRNYYCNRMFFYETKRKDYVIRNFGDYTIYNVNKGKDGRKVYTLIKL